MFSLTDYRRAMPALRVCGTILCGLALLSPLLPLAGCGGDGLRKIHGTVTYRGQPLTKGRIEFWPPDGNGPTAAAPIINGKYSLRLMPGRKLVKIEGFKVIGKRPASLRHPDGVMIDDEVPIVPERYNAKSELFREIAAAEGSYDFHLDDPPGASPQTP
jgi:hypothetical protein